MRTSVAMATYNGAKFLRDQLESISSQSITPDELVISDDCSSDETAQIVRDFAKIAKFDVRLLINPNQLGYISNFEIAIESCTGDIIFLCDQDDVWCDTKIEEHLAAYKSNIETAAVVSDAYVVDHSLLPLNYSLWQYMALNNKRVRLFKNNRSLDLYIKRGFCYGVLLSFRSSYKQYLIPFPTNYSHDDWISIVISCLAPIELIARPLVKYRQHASQLIGAGGIERPIVKDMPRNNVLESDRLLDRLDTLEKRIMPLKEFWIRKDVDIVIKGRRSYLKQRASMYYRSKGSRLLLILINLLNGSYRRYAPYPKIDFISDILGRKN